MRGCRSLTALARVSMFLCALLAFSVSAEPLQSYAPMRPLAGDAHRHAGSAASHLKMAVGVCSDTGMGDPHERGLNIAVYDALRLAGYDWGNLAYHDFAISAGNTNDAYLKWTAPNAPARAVDTQFGYRVVPSRAGFPDWTRCGDGGPWWHRGHREQRLRRHLPGRRGSADRRDVFFDPHGSRRKIRISRCAAGLG